MKQIIHTASAHWNGEANGRAGTVATGSGALHRDGASEGIPPRSALAADPPDFIAAAHASSFSLALADELAAGGLTAGEILTTATLTLEKLPVGWTIVRVNLKVTARFPRLTQAEFIDATIRAKTTCMVSRSLRANISMNAKLEK